jgi:hypothetical protein
MPRPLAASGPAGQSTARIRREVEFTDIVIGAALRTGLGTIGRQGEAHLPITAAFAEGATPTIMLL